MESIALCSIAVASALALVGCAGGSSGREDVERIIESQFADSVRENTGEAVVTQSVTCVDEGDRRFSCIVTVKVLDGSGGTSTVQVPVDASCDSDNCIWRSGT